MKILIIDDNPSNYTKLERILIEWGYTVLGKVGKRIDAKSIIAHEKPDLILMDIDIKAMDNGLEVVKYLIQEIPIIFVSGRNDDITLSTIQDLEGIHLLDNPLDTLSLKALLKLHSTLQQENEKHKFLFRKNNKVFNVPANTIIYIQSDKNYCDVYTFDNYFIVKNSLRNLLAYLPQDLFVKVHKRYVVNISTIKSIIPGENLIKINDNMIPIGRNFKKDFMSKLKMLKNS